MTFTRNAWATLMAVLTTLAVVAVLMFVPNNSATATGGSEPCVPTPASTAVVVVTPAIPATEGTPEIPAVTEEQTVEGTPDLWWNWSPNHQQGPFEGPPAFPIDSRGTWQGPHENGGPSQDTYGTFQQGNGHGSWFHREQGTPDTTVTVEVTPAVPAVPGTPAVPAVTDTVVTPEVVCETTTPTPTDTPTVTPTVPIETVTITPSVPTETATVTPPVVTETVVPPVATETVPGDTDTVTETPEPTKTPVSAPDKDKAEPKPEPVYLIECVDGVFVTTVNGEVVSENGSCVERDENDEPVTFSETGL